MANIFAQIRAGAISFFSQAEKIIEQDAAKAASLVSSTTGKPLVNDAGALAQVAKQGASDALSIGGVLLGDGISAIGTGVEAALDTGLAKAIGPALAAVPAEVAHGYIVAAESIAQAAAKAWVLRQLGGLAKQGVVPQQPAPQLQPAPAPQPAVPATPVQA